MKIFNPKTPLGEKAPKLSRNERLEMRRQQHYQRKNQRSISNNGYLPKKRVPSFASFPQDNVNGSLPVSRDDSLPVMDHSIFPKVTIQNRDFQAKTLEQQDRRQQNVSERVRQFAVEKLSPQQDGPPFLREKMSFDAVYGTQHEGKDTQSSIIFGAETDKQRQQVKQRALEEKTRKAQYAAELRAQMEAKARSKRVTRRQELLNSSPPETEANAGVILRNSSTEVMASKNAKKMQYRLELQRQMADNQARKRQEKSRSHGIKWSNDTSTHFQWPHLTTNEISKKNAKLQYAEDLRRQMQETTMRRAASRQERLGIFRNENQYEQVPFQQRIGMEWGQQQQLAMIPQKVFPEGSVHDFSPKPNTFNVLPPSPFKPQHASMEPRHALSIVQQDYRAPQNSSLRVQKPFRQDTQDIQERQIAAAKKATYAAELREQIRQKKQREENAKMRDQHEDMKADAKARSEARLQTVMHSVNPNLISEYHSPENGIFPPVEIYPPLQSQSLFPNDPSQVHPPFQSIQSQAPFQTQFQPTHPINQVQPAFNHHLPPSEQRKVLLPIHEENVKRDQRNHNARYGFDTLPPHEQEAAIEKASKADKQREVLREQMEAVKARKAKEANDERERARIEDEKIARQREELIAQEAERVRKEKAEATQKLQKEREVQMAEVKRRKMEFAKAEAEAERKENERIARERAEMAEAEKARKERLASGNMSKKQDISMDALPSQRNELFYPHEKQEQSIMLNEKSEAEQLQRNDEEKKTRHDLWVPKQQQRQNKKHNSVEHEKIHYNFNPTAAKAEENLVVATNNKLKTSRMNKKNEQFQFSKRYDDTGAITMEQNEKLRKQNLNDSFVLFCDVLSDLTWHSDFFTNEED
eukprot:g3265.t1